MISAHHFLTLYLGLELLALSLYAMVALQRDSVRATEAAMKYFVLGALASGMLLYGMSMLYGATGSLDIARVAAALGSAHASQSLAVFGLVFVVAGIAFKLGAVPFHMWIPDVYHGAATPATLFIGAAPKIAAFAFVMRLLAHGAGRDGRRLAADARDPRRGLASASGNLVAIAQTNLKRMLAYSTISHMGFLLLGILAGTDNGYSSAMFYVLTYVLMTLGAFGMILLLSRAGFEAEELEDFRGPQPPLEVVRLRDAGHRLLAGGHPAGRRLPRQARRAAGRVRGGLRLAGRVRGADERGGRLLLPAPGEAHVHGRAGRRRSRSPRAPTCASLLSVNALAVLGLGIVPAPLMDLCARAITASL